MVFPFDTVFYEEKGQINDQGLASKFLAPIVARFVVVILPAAASHVHGAGTGHPSTASSTRLLIPLVASPNPSVSWS